MRTTTRKALSLCVIFPNFIIPNVSTKRVNIIARGKAFIGLIVTQCHEEFAETMFGKMIISIRPLIKALFNKFDFPKNFL